jgi:hypothetical protein
VRCGAKWRRLTRIRKVFLLQESPSLWGGKPQVPTLCFHLVLLLFPVKTVIFQVLPLMSLFSTQTPEKMICERERRKSTPPLTFPNFVWTKILQFRPRTVPNPPGPQIFTPRNRPSLFSPLRYLRVEICCFPTKGLLGARPPLPTKNLRSFLRSTPRNRST